MKMVQKSYNDFQITHSSQHMSHSHRDKQYAACTKNTLHHICYRNRGLSRRSQQQNNLQICLLFHKYQNLFHSLEKKGVTSSFLLRKVVYTWQAQSGVSWGLYEGCCPHEKQCVEQVIGTLDNSKHNFIRWLTCLLKVFILYRLSF